MLKEYNLVELMLVCGSREIKDFDVVVVGTGLPVLASVLAQHTHAPHAILVHESGVVDSKPNRMPMSVADASLIPGSASTGDMIDVMGTYLEGGRVDVGFLSGAQVDRYGNINTTCIGDYHHPEVRLVGSGGANPIASLVKRVVIILPHEKRRLVQKVDYLTTPGYISGEGGRENVGLPLRSGPVAIITSMGVLRFDDSKEAYLDTIHPQVDVEQVRKETGWELKIASNLRQTEPPTKGEVRLLREVIDPEGLIKRYLKK